ncbi:MAG: hypothetical protein GQ532_02310 [Methylomarinum sp.]|nr:hypothetical protein [Methylomarinum sp.]
MNITKRIAAMLIEEKFSVSIGEIAGTLDYEQWQVKNVIDTFLIVGYVVCVKDKYKKV